MFGNAALREEVESLLAHLPSASRRAAGFRRAPHQNGLGERGREREVKKSRHEGRALAAHSHYNWCVKPTLEDGLRALREASELAPAIRIELTDDYLDLIARVEGLAQNRSGADKSGKLRAHGRLRDLHTRARLIPRRS
jgi:hypothetical protein